MVLQHVTTKAEIDKICASTSNIVVVDFYADWCGPCKQIAPLFEAMSNKYGSKAVFLKVDTEKMGQQDKTAYAIRSLPTFKIFHKMQTLDTIVGADPAKLEAAIAQHSAKYGAFAGGSAGYRLSGGAGSSAAAATGSSAGRGAGAAAAGAGAGASAAPRRRNPWADPNFVPPGMRKKDEAAPAAAAAAAAAGSAAAPSAASSSSRQPSAAAATRANAAANRQTEAAAPPPAAGKPDATMLATLVSMGFSQAHSERALIATKNRNADAAVTWMLDNPDTTPTSAAPAQTQQVPAAHSDSTPKPMDTSGPEPDTTEPAVAPVAASSDDAKVLDVARQAAAALGGTVVDTTDDAEMAAALAAASPDEPTIDDSLAEMDDSMKEIVEAKRREAQQAQKKVLKGEKLPEILTRKVAELSSEEKQEWLAAKRELVRKQKAVQALENQKEKEKSRRDTGKAALELQRQREEFQRQQLIEARKKAERDKKKQKAELKAKLKAEKEERARARQREREEVERMKAAKAAAAGK